MCCSVLTVLFIIHNLLSMQCSLQLFVIFLHQCQTFHFSGNTSSEVLHLHNSSLLSTCISNTRARIKKKNMQCSGSGCTCGCVFMLFICVDLALFSVSRSPMSLDLTLSGHYSTIQLGTTLTL